MNYNNAKFERSYGTSSQLPPGNIPEIVFSGRSNVGKSSLMNKLFNRKSLARTSSVPGKTVTINFFDVDGKKFVDLPGYGYAKLPKAEKQRFGELMDGYFSGQRNIRLVVQLVDMRHKPSADDYNMIDFLLQMNIPFVIALTKSDKLKPTEYKKRLEESKKELECAQSVPIIPFSTKNGQGVEALKQCIDNSLL